MPTYDYECTRCGELQELFHGMNEAPRVRCKGCGGTARKRIGAGAGLIFKGSGFYQTDYRSSGYVNAAKAEQSAASSGGAESKTAAGATSGPASEAAPAAKPAPKAAAEP